MKKIITITTMAAMTALMGAPACGGTTLDAPEGSVQPDEPRAYMACVEQESEPDPPADPRAVISVADCDAAFAYESHIGVDAGQYVKPPWQ